jgi:hypothetical protein
MFPQLNEVRFPKALSSMDMRVGDGELPIRRNQKLLAEATKRAFPDLPRTIPDPVN